MLVAALLEALLRKQDQHEMAWRPQSLGSGLLGVPAAIVGANWQRARASNVRALGHLVNQLSYWPQDALQMEAEHPLAFLSQGRRTYTTKTDPAPHKTLHPGPDTVRLLKAQLSDLFCQSTAKHNLGSPSNKLCGLPSNPRVPSAPVPWR